MTERKGCLLSLFPGASPARLATGALPRLATSACHPADRPALQRAQTAAEAAHRAFAGPAVPDAAVADLADQLGKLLEAVHRLAKELARVRGFLVAHAPEKLARERADLEMRRLGASAGEILALRTASAALAERARLAEQATADVATLSARLMAAGQELEAFRARVEARTDAEQLGHELAAYRDSALRALEVYDRTRRELEALGGGLS